MSIVETVGDDDVSVGVEPGLRLQPFLIGQSLWPVVAAAERAFALVLLALTLPLLVIGAVVAAIFSRQSPFIAHNRVGEGGGDLWLIKIRTMWNARPSGKSTFWIERLPIDKCAQLTPKTNHDPRVSSAFAALCRRHSIDELPQLWQIARGQLALVGPRPLTKCEIEHHYGSDAKLLLSRKPGLTGLWQVSGRSRLSYRQRRRLDLFLIRKWSLPLYFLILGRTLYRMPAGKDAW